MRYMSVCSGVEAASLAWQGLGWEPVAFSEIEPFPCAVLAARFPDVPNLGDMTKIEVTDEEIRGAGFAVCRREVGLLVGGTPCQSFSVAGRREGLKGASGLAFHFVRLLREIQPEWFVWENVPGALSSRTDGQLDFNFLVRAFAECGYGLAWRILDAQYVRSHSFPFAIPQRRRRLFVVGCLGDGGGAGKVLLEGEGLCGDITPRRITMQGASGCTERSPGVSVRTAHTKANGCGIGVGTAHTLGTGDVDAVLDASAFNFELFSGERKGVSPCITRKDADRTLIYREHDSPFSFAGDTVDSYEGKTIFGKDVSNTIIAGLSRQVGTTQDATCVFTKEAHPRNATEGQGWRKTDIAKTLNTFCSGETRAEELIVGYDNHPNDSRVTEVSGSFACLPSKMGTGGNNTPLVLHTGTTPAISRPMVRRLTPVEAERLMGFPDNWTRIPWRGKPAEKCPDAPRYKACGNSFCVNCVEWIGERIEKVERALQEERR